MDANQEKIHIRIDRPLQQGTAIKNDLLGREIFANRITKVLQQISADAGLVVSVEGAWGCGKTSILAMVEDILGGELIESRPIVVHFNPWLVGDRDALLNQFLSSLAQAVELTSHALEGKKVATELKTYAKAIGLLKLIPGAEPWASILKSVVESAGDAGEAVFDYKAPNIETRKRDLGAALRKFDRRIVVLVDDIDRLYPAEVYEMVRIIKAVGDLPNVGYVLAWDEKFVSAALDNLKVPFASTYLDKVVQIRFSVPPLSFSNLVEQMDNGLKRLPLKARQSYFSNENDRYSMIFHHGLSELMEHPRDVIRLFDMVIAIEETLRGEVHLADLIGFAALMNKAPSVFSLLKRTPRAFVGGRSSAGMVFADEDEVVKERTLEREAAIEACDNPRAVRELVNYLFPKTAKHDDDFHNHNAVFTEGHIAHPNRLSVALQLSTGAADVSLVNVRRFLFHPSERSIISRSLTERTCVPFLDCLTSMVEGFEEDIKLDIEALAIALARLIESPPFVQRSRVKKEEWLLSAENLALGAIETVCKRAEPSVVPAIAESLIEDKDATSMAVLIAKNSFVDDGNTNRESYIVKAASNRKERVLKKLGENLIDAATSGELFDKVSPRSILWFAPLLVSPCCERIFLPISKVNAKLDSFVMAFFGVNTDAIKEPYFSLPSDPKRVTSYISTAALLELSKNRLLDKKLDYPARAAWQMLLDGVSRYAKDGSKVKK